MSLMAYNAFFPYQVLAVCAISLLRSSKNWTVPGWTVYRAAEERAQDRRRISYVFVPWPVTSSSPKTRLLC